MRRGGCIDGVARDVIVDQAANAVIDAIGIVEIFRKVVGKYQPAALDVVEPAVQRHAFEGEFPQIDIAAAIPSRQIMVGVLADLFLQAVLVDRQSYWPRSSSHSTASRPR